MLYLIYFPPRSSQGSQQDLPINGGPHQPVTLHGGPPGPQHTILKYILLSHCQSSCQLIFEFQSKNDGDIKLACNELSNSIPT